MADEDFYDHQSDGDQYVDDLVDIVDQTEHWGGKIHYFSLYCCCIDYYDN